MLIVGSQALSTILILDRKPSDWDLIVQHDLVDLVAKDFGDIVNRTDDMVTFRSNTFAETKTELLIARPGNAMWEYLKVYDAFGTKLKYMDAHGLYSLKKSHVHIPMKFDKHIKDYCLLHEIVKGKDKYPDITKMNNDDIKKRIGKRFNSPSLNKSVEEFFAQSEGKVKSFFVHDRIHEIMAHYDRPLYEKMQHDLNMAKCEKDLWEKFSRQDKMRCVLEEAYVIALERKIIPVMYGGETPYFSPKKALEWAMMRVCTTLTGGWFRKFATDNYLDIIKFADLTYSRRFFQAVDKGEIKFIKEKKLLKAA